MDLFILDIQLLDYRGTELAKQLRAIPEYRFTPILFTTELSGEELSAYREIKCYDFLVKPFTEAEFSRLVQCHKSFLVNPARINRIDKGSRLLYLNGCEAAIPIGEKFQQNLLGHGGSAWPRF